MRLMGILMVLLAPLPTAAQPLDIRYGANEIDLNADGSKDLIVKVRRENGNAHAYDKYFISVRLEGPDDHHQFYEVPVGASYAYTLLRNKEGADCFSGEFSFALNTSGILEVTSFSRPIGSSMMDPQPVTITTYRLTEYKDPEEGYRYPGNPIFYLKEVNKTTTEQSYCDVRDLM